jgi:GNAT superfamily N-acetyltransferase
MARHASTLQGRPLPPKDDPDVVALLPDSPDAAIIAVAHTGRRLGAIWWVLHDPPLLLDQQGNPLPELAMAVVKDERGKGIGRALIDALLGAIRHQFAVLTLNVHLLNPAVRLYVRTGFTVTAAGRGRYGVAMSRALDG